MLAKNKQTCGMKTFAFIASLSASFLANAATQPTTFVHLFEWQWQDVAKECEQYLAPNGYAAVQVSPPNEHIQGSAWWTRYQPVSYQIESRGGSRTEFANMVSRCNAVGVDIYVDAVINHMAAGAGVGVAGSAYGQKSFPIFSPHDFHDTCAITDYNNRWQVQNCELVGLADLNTSANYVQNSIAGYLNDLQSLGVAGFRIDAAKHMAIEDIQGILSKVEGSPLIFQEVIDQGGEAISSSEYLSNGLVTEFNYSTKLGETFRNGKLAWLESFGEGWGFMPSHNAVVFVDNHDNQRGHGGGGSVITFEDGRLYDLANVFMLAYPYGYPKVMSSYEFHGDTDAGAPNGAVHTKSELACFGDTWQCEHRRNYIVGGVDFRNHTAANWQLTHWWDNEANQIAFGRGSFGFVAINKEQHRMLTTLSTAMSPGVYCNVLTGSLSNDGETCSGDTIRVNTDGTINADIAPWEAFAIHQGAKTNVVAPPVNDWQRTVIFISASTQSGQDMFIRGGIDHAYANQQQGRNCSDSNFACSIAIKHRNLRNETTRQWKINDHYLDWYGSEIGQTSTAQGSALDWTTDQWPSTWGERKTVNEHGFGEEPLNLWGAHYWMLDVDMDCNQTINGQFEVKAYVKNGQGWESDIAQPNTPYITKNHVAQCGKINRFVFNNNIVEILDF